MRTNCKRALGWGNKRSREQIIHRGRGDRSIHTHTFLIHYSLITPFFAFFFLHVYSRVHNHNTLKPFHAFFQQSNQKINAIIFSKLRTFIPIHHTPDSILYCNFFFLCIIISPHPYHRYRYSYSVLTFSGRRKKNVLIKNSKICRPGQGLWRNKKTQKKKKKRKENGEKDDEDE